jgi:hypothetical protein
MQTTSVTASTNVADFFADLDGGVFERGLSVALSQVAGSTCEHDGTGEVVIKLNFKRVPGAAMVHCEHTLQFTRPTADGSAGEKQKRTTTMHVGKNGKVTLAPENQLAMFDRSGEVAPPPKAQ